VTFERDGLVARCNRNWPPDPDFIKQWNALLARSPNATVFNSFGWQRAGDGWNTLSRPDDCGSSRSAAAMNCWPFFHLRCMRHRFLETPGNG